MGKIADISHYQGDIDWSKARKELDLVIFRASVGSNADKKYLEYTAECGVPYGAYHYVKAGTAEDARTEARFFVECAHKAAKRPLFYIADIEYEAQTETTTEPVCVAFLEELRALLGDSVKIGLYINRKYKWAGAAIGMCDIMWIPHWGKNDGNVPEEKYQPDYYCDIWQYTSEGSVAGIDGDVDLNLLLGDKPLEYFTEGYVPDEMKGSESVMDSKFSGVPTNLHLVAWMIAAHVAKVVYWYGTCFYECTKSLYTRKKNQYSKYYTSARESGYMADIAAGKMCADCVGIIKGFFWTGGDPNGKNVYEANNCPDRSANGLFSLCKETGKISTIPDIPGLVVWRDGHIGVYIGDGETIELKGFAYDCERNDVGDGSWTHWGKLPPSMMNYVTDGASVPAPAKLKLGDRLPLKKGDKGDDVAELQTALKTLGFDLGTYGPKKDGIDGDYGTKTRNAVSDLQRTSDMKEDGVFDTPTYKALLNRLSPAPEPEPDTPDGGSAPAYMLIIEGDEDDLRKIQADHGGTLAAVDSVIMV